MTTLLESAILADSPIALFTPDPSTGTVIDRTGNYTATLTNGASVTSDELVSGAPGAISLDGTYVTTTFGTRRNLCTNPSFETNTTGYSNDGAVTLSRDTTEYKYGSASLKAVTSGAASFQGVNLPTATVVNGQVYTVSAWVKGTAGAALLLYTALGNTTFTATGAWQLVSKTITANSTSLASRILTNGTLATTFYLDGVMVEQAASAGTYFDGSGYVNASGSWVASSGLLCGWLGTAHASASDKGVFANGTTRTVVAAVKRDATTDADTLWGSSASSSYPAARLGSGGTTLSVSTDQSETETFTSVAASTPTLVAVEIAEASNTVKVWVNGAAHGSNPATHSAQYAARQTFQIGAYGSGSDPFDGLIGPVAIFDRALTSVEHATYADLVLNGPPRCRIVREKPPATQITAVSTDGRRTRWAADELDPSRVPSGARWSTSIPGGSDTFNATLPRDPERAYSDLGLLTELRVIRDGGRTQTYRLEETPKVSGDQMAIEPAAKGYRAALEDRSDVRALFVDRDLSGWGDISRTYKLGLIPTYTSVDTGSVSMDVTNGLPALMQDLVFAGTHKPYVGNLYDAGEGLTIGAVYYDTTATGWTPPAPGLTAQISFSPGDDAVTGSTSSDLEGANTGYYAPTAQRFAFIEFIWVSAASTADVTYTQTWRKLAVYGDHGLTRQGSDPGGFYTGQMVEWLVSNKTSLTAGDIDDGTFLHPHAAFQDPGTALAIIENLTRYEPLYDWMVWDKEFSFQRRGTYGKRWRARVGPSGLRSSGQTLDRLYNEVAVRFNDPLYGDLTVGPVGSGYGTTSADLTDDDPDNPVNKAGATRRVLLDMGTGTAAGAVEVGKRFLEETKRLDNSGQCELSGFVEDDAGTYWPVDEVRAGDQISFTDSVDASWRHIAATDYSADSQTNSLSIDAPPQTLDGLLARLQAVLVPLG